MQDALLVGAQRDTNLGECLHMHICRNPPIHHNTRIQTDPRSQRPEIATIQGSTYSRYLVVLSNTGKWIFLETQIGFSGGNIPISRI